MTKSDTRIYELEKALEGILDCIEDGGPTTDNYYIDVEVDNPDGTYIAGAKLGPEATEMVEHAIQVLYGDDPLELGLGQIELDFLGSTADQEC